MPVPQYQQLASIIHHPTVIGDVTLSLDSSNVAALHEIDTVYAQLIMLDVEPAVGQTAIMRPLAITMDSSTLDSIEWHKFLVGYAIVTTRMKSSISLQYAQLSTKLLNGQDGQLTDLSSLATLSADLSTPNTPIWLDVHMPLITGIPAESVRDAKWYFGCELSVDSNDFQVSFDGWSIAIVLYPNPNFSPIPTKVWTNAHRLRRFTDRVIRRRAGRFVNILLGDSTTLLGGMGHDEGHEAAMQSIGLQQVARIGGFADNNGNAASYDTGHGTKAVYDYWTGNVSGSDAYLQNRNTKYARITSSLVSGSFTLTYNGVTGETRNRTTGAIAWNATAADVVAALIATGEFAAPGGAGTRWVRVMSGTSLNAGPIEIEFCGSSHSDLTKDLLLTASSGSVTVFVGDQCGNTLVPFYRSSTGTADVRTIGIWLGSMVTPTTEDPSFAVTYDGVNSWPYTDKMSSVEKIKGRWTHLVGTGITGNPVAIRKDYPADEYQYVQVRGSAGTFAMTFSGQTTSALAIDASASTVQTALRALSTIGASNVNVTAYTRRMYVITCDAYFADNYELRINPAGQNGSHTVVRRLAPRVCVVEIDSTSGTFTLTHGDYTTGSISVTASAATVLAAMTTAGFEDSTGSLTVELVYQTYYRMAFAGTLAGADQPQITVNYSGLSSVSHLPATGTVGTVSYGTGGYSNFATPTLSSNTGAVQAALTSTEISASASRITTVSLCHERAGSTITAPYNLLFGSLSHPDRRVGYMQIPLVARGGRGLRKYAEIVQRFTQAWWNALITHINDIMTESLDSDCQYLVWIWSGANDQNDTLSSMGPSPTASNTVAGFKDNLAANRTAIRNLMSGAGVDLSKVTFIVVVSPPQDASDSVLSGYRTAAKDFSAVHDDVVVCDLTECSPDYSFTEAQRVNLTDAFHHSRHFYHVVLSRAWQTMASAAESDSRAVNVVRHSCTGRALDPE